MKRHAYLMSALVFFPSHLAADRIVLKNGDRISGLCGVKPAAELVGNWRKIAVSCDYGDFSLVKWNALYEVSACGLTLLRYFVPKAKQPR